MLGFNLAVYIYLFAEFYNYIILFLYSSLLSSTSAPYSPLSDTLPCDSSHLTSLSLSSFVLYSGRLLSSVCLLLSPGNFLLSSAWKLSPGIKAGQLQESPVYFSLRDHCLALSVVQCLETVVCILSWFRRVGKSSPCYSISTGNSLMTTKTKPVMLPILPVLWKNS